MSELCVRLLLVVMMAGGEEWREWSKTVEKRMSPSSSFKLRALARLVDCTGARQVLHVTDDCYLSRVTIVLRRVSLGQKTGSAVLQPHSSRLVLVDALLPHTFAAS